MANNHLSWVGSNVFNPNQTRQPSGTSVAPSAASPSTYTAGLDTLGPAVSTQAPSGYTAPAITQSGPPLPDESLYIPGYLNRNLGRNIKAEFVVGTNQYVEKVGRLIEVGANFFVLEDENSRTHIMCDLYSAKFITVIMF